MLESGRRISIIIKCLKIAYYASERAHIDKIIKLSYNYGQREGTFQLIIENGKWKIKGRFAPVLSWIILLRRKVLILL